MSYRPTDLSLLKGFWKFLNFKHEVIFSISRQSRVIIVVLGNPISIRGQIMPTILKLAFRISDLPHGPLTIFWPLRKYILWLRLSKGAFKNNCGQNFAIFWPWPPLCVNSFYTLNVDKNRHFLTHSPPHLVHVVIEWPLIFACSWEITDYVLAFQKII